MLGASFRDQDFWRKGSARALATHIDIACDQGFIVEIWGYNPM